MKAYLHSQTLQTSTYHTKLTIGTKTKHLKKIETYCQQQHMLEIQKSINSNNLQHPTHTGSSLRSLIEAASTHFDESSSPHLSTTLGAPP